MVVVLGHERLYSDMTRILRDKPEISVVKVAKSGGVSFRSAFRNDDLAMGHNLTHAI